METFATRLRYAMTVRGLKQVDLCNLTGMPKSVVSSYLSAKFSPRMDAILLLSKTLRVYPPWLMGYDVPMEQQDDPSTPEPAKPKMTPLQEQAVAMVLSATDEQLVKLIKILEAIQ